MAQTDGRRGRRPKKRRTARQRRLRPAYATARGAIYLRTIEEFLESPNGRELRGKVQLIFTSPPFPLNTKKKYGNLQGEKYLEWLSDLAPKLKMLLKPDGSLVMEVGNSWEPGSPVMSTLALKALLRFQEKGDLHLCEQFIYYNPARLPSPVQWVNIERIRVKDSFTHIWWMSPTERPKADNRRVLKPYSKSMTKLLSSGKYNAGVRPSEHRIGKTSFLRDNKGAIPSNVLTFSNTVSQDGYLDYCRRLTIRPHPARMPRAVPEFFIRLLTLPRNLVFDPFAGSNTTGAAAERLKRRWVSVEALANYVKTSRGRFTPEKNRKMKKE